MLDLSRTSISAVCVVEDCAPDAAVLARLIGRLADAFGDSEIVIVANGSPDEAAVALKALTERLPDITVAFLGDRIDRDTAVLTGIENAIGDWILVIEPTSQLVDALPKLIAEVHKGFDVVLGLPAQAWERKRLHSPLQRSYIAVYNWLSGGTALAERPAVSLLSRAAALHVLRSADGEMLLRSRRIAGGFPSSAVTIDDPGYTWPVPKLVDSAGKGMRLLLASSSAPLRFISIVGFLGSASALAYTVYVVLVYFFKEDVQPGWTTMSLQLSFLTFILSGMLALLAEYVVQIHGASFARRRYIVSREIRSQLSSRSGRVNVVDPSGPAGRYKLGAPDDLLPDSVVRLPKDNK